MSDKDNHPTQGDDGVRPVYPVLFDGQDTTDTNFTDWRAHVVPADAEEEKAPKASSVPAPASTSESPMKTAAKVSAKPAPVPAAKGSTPAKATSPGTPSS